MHKGEFCMEKVRAAVCGYGNLGRAVERTLAASDDLFPAAVFTRRPQVAAAQTDTPVFELEALFAPHPELDVAILCGSSAYDLAWQTPRCAEFLPFVDSFDIHSQARRHFDEANAAARGAGTVGVVSAGWDPGLFSLDRCLGEAFLPGGHTATFWGKGVSQGHSAAIRGVAGVRDARQYTVPEPLRVAEAREADAPARAAQSLHVRECCVVAEPGADKKRIEREIRSMPGYFEGWRTRVHFVSERWLRRRAGMQHAGRVIRAGRAPDASAHVMERTLTLGSNPAFTANVLCACARAAVRLAKSGATGCRTMLDIPPALYHPAGGRFLLQQLL